MSYFHKSRRRDGRIYYKLICDSEVVQYTVDFESPPMSDSDIALNGFKILQDICNIKKGSDYKKITYEIIVLDYLKEFSEEELSQPLKIKLSSITHEDSLWKTF